jgi:hypothetical protein
MPDQLALTGDVLPVDDQEIEALRAEVRRQQRLAADAQVEAKRAKEDAERAMGALRRQLSPLYRALQLVFGELDDAGVGEDAPSGHASGERVADDTREAKVWAEWKQKLGAGSAASRIIDGLQTHGGSTVKQLKVICKASENTLYPALSRLSGLGLIEKSGSRYSLRQL